MGEVITFRPRPHPAPTVVTREMVERTIVLALDVVDGLIGILEPDNDREDGGDDELSLVFPLRGS